MILKCENRERHMNLQVPTKYQLSASLLIAVLTTFNIACANKTNYAGSDFSEPRKFKTGAMPWFLKLGDLNGDNKPDIVTANLLQPGRNGLSVLLNTTSKNSKTPTLSRRKSLKAGPMTSAVTLADFNGDGMLDIGTANTGAISRDVTILINATAINADEVEFKKPFSFRAGFITHLVVAGDLNADGKPDLVTGNSGSRGGKAVSVLLNTTRTLDERPTFTPATHFGGGKIAEGLVLGDVNNDGKLDIIEGNTLSGTVTVLINETEDSSLSPSFTGPSIFPVSFATAVDLGDFNQDGKLDIVAASTRGGAYLLINETEKGAPKPSFSEAIHFDTGGDVTEGIVVADFNGDGLPDFAANNNNLLHFLRKDGVAVFYNQTPLGESKPVFDGPHTYEPSPGANSIAAGDINGDGLPDLAVGVVNPFGINGLSLLLNKQTKASTTP